MTTPPPVDTPAAPAPARRPGLLPVIGLALVVGFAGGLAGFAVADQVQDDEAPAAQQPLGGERSDDGEDSGSTPAATVDGFTIGQIYRRFGPGVVHIRAEVSQTSNSIFGIPQEERGTASGSGFVVDKDGHVVTNFHVVDNATKVEVSFGGENAEDIPAEIIGTDPTTDLAVLKLDLSDSDRERGLVPLSLGDSSKVQVGDPVVAIGNPFDLESTVTSGIVSALQRNIPSPEGRFQINNAIQTDAAINSGNSGGPLLNAQGEVIGVNSQIQTPSGGNVGIAFAIPANTVERVVDELLKEGKVEHAFFGIEGSDISDEIADLLKLPVKEGALVSRVFPDSPAAEAGLKGGQTEVQINGQEYSLGGDIVTKIDDETIETMREVVEIVDSHKPGDTIKVEYYRGDEKETTDVKLAQRPKETTTGQEQQ